MAQTTGVITGSLGKIEISFDDGSTWKDISGSSCSIDSVEYTRVSGSKATFDGTFRVVTTGKQDMATIGITALYTETADEATLLAVSGIKNNTPCDLRWQYADVTAVVGATYKRYYSLGKSRIASVQLPEINAESGEPAVMVMSITMPGIDYETITVA